MLRNEALAKETKMIHSSLCSDNYICIIDFEIQVASIFPLHAGKSHFHCNYILYKSNSSVP